MVKKGGEIVAQQYQNAEDYWDEHGEAIQAKFYEKAGEYIDTTKEFSVRVASGGKVVLQQAGSAAASGIEITSEFLTGTAAPAVAHVTRTHLVEEKFHKENFRV